MIKKQRLLTTGELDQKLMDDPEWIARKADRDRKFAELEAWLDLQERPIINELRVAGYIIKSVWDFVNSNNYYDSAIPILFKHLADEKYPDRIREGIARALAMPQARYLWPSLLEMYREAPSDRKYKGYKDGLAVALAVLVTSETIDELIALAKDTRHGDSRIFFLKALKKSNSRKAKQAIEELADDPALAKEISSWRRNKK